jgi:diaminopimelate epimerase
MKFSKFHGTGNDFIIIEPQESGFDYQLLAREICDRHKGIGADGLLYYSKSNIADIKMNYINQDGSIAKMCGNGIRCLAKYVYEERIVVTKKFVIETLDGLKEVEILEDNNIKVNMGSFSLDEKKHITIDGINDMNYSIKIQDQLIKAYSVEFGVPHTVIIEEEHLKNNIDYLGPIIENKSIYLNGTNVNFAKVINESKIELKTWERGAGHTLSCGTGSCATAIILNYLGLVNNKVEIIVEGGILRVVVSENIFLIGPSIRVCDGEYHRG